MRNLRQIFTVGILGIFTAVTNVYALEYPLPAPGNSVIGHIRTIHASNGDTLGTIGHRYDIGYVEMAEANPELDPDVSLASGTEVIIPSRFILPEAPRSGLVINLSELRLYYYPPGKGTVVTMPVGIGREGWETPLGTTRISAKTKDPSWYPTPSVRSDAASQGYYLPKVVPPGPDNPLGRYSMRLGGTSYLIHSTNKAEGVGRRSSAGCMRMLPQDAAYLFKHVGIGTPVHIVDQPYKVAWSGSKLYLEVHEPLQERRQNDGSDFAPLIDNLLRVAKLRNYHIDWQAVKRAADEQDGVPLIVGKESSQNHMATNSDPVPPQSSDVEANTSGFVAASEDNDVDTDDAVSSLEEDKMIGFEEVSANVSPHKGHESSREMRS